MLWLEIIAYTASGLGMPQLDRSKMMRGKGPLLTTSGHSDGSWRTIFPFREVAPVGRRHALSLDQAVARHSGGVVPSVFARGGVLCDNPAAKDAALKTVAYLRVSTRSQDLANQKLAILEFSQKRRFPIDQFIESRISSRKSPLERRIDEMLGTLQPGDRLLVSELSRLGRSLSQVIQIVETLVRRKIRFIAYQSDYS